MDDHQQKLVKLLDLFVEQVHNKFNKYAFYFFLCELLNIIITVIMVIVNLADDKLPSFVLFKIGATHIFLHHQYFDYGINIYQYYRFKCRNMLSSKYLTAAS